MKAAISRPQNAVFLLLLLVAVLYSDTVYSYYALWMKSGNPAYSHGLLAFLIAVFIFFKYWRQQDRLPPLRMSFIGLTLLFASSLLWFIAGIGNIQVVQQLALWALIGSLFWGLFGFKMFEMLLIPLAVVLTAVPVWDFLNIHLQHITAVGVSFLLGFTGIPFVKEGVHILLQSGTFEIADRCSGLRMVVAAIAIALLYIYQSRLRGGYALIYLLASVLLAIFVNIIRILIVVIAGHLTNMQHYFVTTDHVVLGWVLFGVAIFAFIFASNRVLLSDRWYHRVTRNSDTLPEHNEAGQGQMAVAHSFTARSFITLGVGVVGISMGPVLATVFQPSPDYQPSAQLDLALRYGAWQKDVSGINVWKPEYRGSDAAIHARYQWSPGDDAPIQPSTASSSAAMQNTANTSRDKPANVTVYLYYYYNQAQGKEAIHYQNQLFDTKNWELLRQKRINTTVAGVGPIQADEVVIKSPTGHKKLLWRWYYVGGSRSASTTRVKVMNIKGVLTGHPETTVFMLGTDLSYSREQASATLADFAAASLPAMEFAVDSAVSTNRDTE